MSTGWVAAGVRARAMARRRVGGGAARRVADAPDLPSALALLEATSAGTWLGGCTTVAQVARAGAAELLWSMRVLAGWLPARGTGVLRALAAGFEVQNLLGRAAQLTAATVPAPYELGALATAWPRARRTTSLPALRSALRASAWGDPGTDEALADVLGVSWLARVAVEAPGTQPWARDAVALVLARRLLLDDAPAPRLVTAGRRLAGTSWPGARTLDALRDALPREARAALEPVAGPNDLWRAEAALRGRVQTDAFAMLREPTASPRVVVGAVAVLAVDTWRVVAALGAAASGPAGGGGREVLDAAA